jgi:hypothetical protein
MAMWWSGAGIAPVLSRHSAAESGHHPKPATVVTISPSVRRAVRIKIRIILDVIGEPFKLLAVLLSGLPVMELLSRLAPVSLAVYRRHCPKPAQRRAGYRLIAFINLRLITGRYLAAVLPEFLGLLLLLMAVTLGPSWR